VLMLYLALIHGLVNGALAVGVLQYRSLLAERKKNELLTQLSLAQQQVNQERSFREDREQLLAMLAHELKTPLATIQFLLGSRAVDDKAVGNIKKATSDMNMVIERSVQMGQFDNGQLSIEKTATNVVHEINELISRQADPLAIMFNAPPTLVVQTDPDLLRIICVNLLDNAMKYRAPETQVQVTIDPPTPAYALSLRVENQVGTAGFPDPALVFDRYYRAPKARGFTGSGLGLYLVKGLAHQLGGEIYYQPTDTTICFHLCLPN
jgi:two-component system, sensor histidine kinase LadS